MGPPSPNGGNYLTVLSIDGGGVRGIIPGIILAELESQLQARDKNPEARLVDYFDVIAGTSTGGLLIAMLTSPNANDRPLYRASEIVEFYKKHSPQIFSQKRGRNCWLANFLFGWLFNLKNIWSEFFRGPKYKGEYLHELVKVILGGKIDTKLVTLPDETVHQAKENVKLDKTLTNIVIPSFDINYLQPTIFSTYKAKEDSEEFNASVADVCIGTSAAPTYLPAHYFKGGDRVFNLVDGAVAANNPTLIAISEVTKEVAKHSDRFMNIQPGDYHKFLVLSLGTGIPQAEHKYNADMVNKWGKFWGWIYKWGYSSPPLLDFFMESSSDMVDYHNHVIFKALGIEDQYLRIQEDALEPGLSSMDVATNENLEALENVSIKLLTKEVKRVNVDTGKHEPAHYSNNKDDGKFHIRTNKEELKNLAGKLSNEMRLRREKQKEGLELN